MASTARKESEKKEYFDPPPILQRKVDQLVSMIRESKHMIIFTVSNIYEKVMHLAIHYGYVILIQGAGISTGAGSRLLCSNDCIVSNASFLQFLIFVVE